MADRRESHEGHDPVVIARLLDRDIAADERAAAESLIASCPSCAALHADLLALATATRAQPTPAAASVLHAHRGRRRAPGRAGERGTGWRDAPSQRCHDRSFPRVRPCLARHDPGGLARRSLTPGQRARRGRGARRHVQPVRRPAGRPPRTPRRDQGDAHTRAADRLHADRARRSAPPFRRLAPLRGDPRDVARRPQPAARGRADDAGPRRSPRLRGPVLHDGQCLVRGRSDDHRCARPGVRRPRTATGRRRSARRRSLRPRLRLRRPHPPPRPRRHLPARRDQSAAPHAATGRDRGRCHAASGHRGVHQRHGKGAGRLDRRQLREPDSTSDLLAAQDIGGVSPLPVLSVAFLVAGLALFALRWTARRFGG